MGKPYRVEWCLVWSVGENLTRSYTLTVGPSLSSLILKSSSSVIDEGNMPFSFGWSILFFPAQRARYENIVTDVGLLSWEKNKAKTEIILSQYGGPWFSNIVLNTSDLWYCRHWVYTLCTLLSGSKKYFYQSLVAKWIRLWVNVGVKPTTKWLGGCGLKSHCWH